MKKLILFIMATVTLISIAACTPPALAVEARSNKPRNATPNAPASDVTTLVNGNSVFAFNLYQALKDTDGNLFYSPYSISEALAMTYAGARGNTEQQMAAALQFQLTQDQLHLAYNSLALELARRGQGAKGSDGKGFRLNIVNAIWGQQGFAFLPGYLDLLSQNYGAGLRLVDFIKNTEPSREAINQWVSEQTEQKIKDLLPKGSIDRDTRLVLTNAIYFNAAWASAFKESATTGGKFHLLNGDEVMVKLMKQTASYGYARGTNYQAIEMPYDGNELSMVILLPNADQFKSFESALNNRQANDIINSIKYQQVALTLPKFRIESQFSLKKALSSLGMTDAFTDADFSGMDGKKDLQIADVVHKAYVSVDEAGTEAAAATGVIMQLTAMPVEQLQVTVDRPFIFFIRDIKTGAILFTGRVLNPAE
ncbi:MAG: serpin family protein [Dehalococcoidales bacterium]|nr:serpin family protein [Dehalococcoidales bacterium]